MILETLAAATLCMFVGIALILMAKDETSVLYGVAKTLGASFFIVLSMVMAATIALQRLGLGG